MARTKREFNTYILMLWLSLNHDNQAIEQKLNERGYNAKSAMKTVRALRILKQKGVPINRLFQLRTEKAIQQFADAGYHRTKSLSMRQLYIIAKQPKHKWQSLLYDKGYSKNSLHKPCQTLHIMSWLIRNFHWQYRHFARFESQAELRKYWLMQFA